MTAPTCPTTGKRGYPSAKQARRASATNGKRVRVYQCKFCRRFHVTTERHEGGAK